MVEFVPTKTGAFRVNGMFRRDAVTGRFVGMQPKAEEPQPEERLRVQVGDLIASGSGDHTQVLLICWTNRPSDLEGWQRVFPSGDSSVFSSSNPTPVDAVILLPKRGDGAYAGHAMSEQFLNYVGWLTYTDSDDQDEFTNREGHTWEVTVPGYRHVTHDWWTAFRS